MALRRTYSSVTYKGCGNQKYQEYQNVFWEITIITKITEGVGESIRASEITLANRLLEALGHLDILATLEYLTRETIL